MNKKLVFKACAVSAALVLGGCLEDESLEQLPAPVAKKPAVSKPAPSAVPKAEEPELQPIDQVADGGFADDVPSTPSFSGDVKGLQSSSGYHVIQIGIRSTEDGANAFISKLSNSGIDAYKAEVEDPGQLEGVFYRIRVGYFKSVSDAKRYGDEVLGPQGYAFWVDNRTNDNVGNPSGGDYESSYESAETEEAYEATSQDDWAQEESSPVVEQAVAEQEDAGWGSEPAAEPAPEPTPAEPVVAEPAADEGWGESAPEAPAAPAAEPAPSTPTEPEPKLDVAPAASEINTDNGMAAQTAQETSDDWGEPAAPSEAAPAAEQSSGDDWGSDNSGGSDDWSTGDDEGWQ